MDRELLEIIRIISNKNMIPLMEIEHNLSITHRQLVYRIDKINQILNDNDYPEMTITSGKNKQLVLHNDSRNFFIQLINEQLSAENYIMSKKERLIYLYLMMFIHPEYLALTDFMVGLNVSRSSILADLKELGQYLEEYHVSIENNRQVGYYLKGDEMDIRKVMMAFVIYSLSEQHNARVFDEFIEYMHLDIFEYSRLVISELADKHKIRFVEDRLNEFIYIFIFLKKRIVSGDTLNAINFPMDMDALESMKEYEFTLELIRNYKDNQKITQCEINYISSWILGISFGDVNEPTKDCLFIADLVGKIMERFMYLSGQRYKSGEEIFKQLYSHFRPAYYRLIFRLPIFNPLTQRIKEEFGELYHLVAETMKPFQITFDQPLPEDEIAYLTIHFAVIYLDKADKKVQNQKTALVVCSNGIGSSAILFNELSSMFPELHFLPPIESSRVASLMKSVDIIFTTSLIQLPNVNVPTVRVSPIMNLTERYQVYKEVYTQLGDNTESKQANVNDIMAIIEKYADIKYKESLYSDLLSYFATLEAPDPVGHSDEFNLLDLLKQDYIQLHQNASNWQDAIKLGYKPLLDDECITQNYVDDTIRAVQLNGPYIVIMPGVALSNTKIEAGVNKAAIGLTVLNTPVQFHAKTNDPVSYIFSLAATDRNKHLKAMAQLVDLLNAPQFFTLLRHANSPQLIIDYICNFNFSN